MKLSLDIDQANDTAFSPGNKLQGRLKISRHGGHKQPNCTATFGGRITISVPPQVAGPSPNESVYTLFEEAKQLEYDNTELRNAGPDNDVYFVPFSFRFPSHIRCSVHSHFCQLPPSMDVRQGTSRIKVEYYITAAVDRHIMGQVSKKKRVTKGLQLNNSLSIYSPPTSLSIASIPLTLQRKNSPDHPQDGVDGLPPYTPSLHIQVVNPQPAVLFRGQANPIKFVVHTPSEAVGKIFVRKVNINFKTSTAAVVGSMTQRVNEQCSGASISGAIPVDSEMLEFDSGIWERFFMLNLQPTFESCVMEIKHSVEISVGISVGLEGTVQYTSSWMDVLVMDPPPAYEDTQMPQN